MKVMKVRFLKDWPPFKKGDEMTNEGGKFIPKDNLGQVRGLNPLKYIDICYLINTGSLIIKEILDKNQDGEEENKDIDYYV